MPIYEYACRKCNHRIDALQKISDPPLTDCPECGAVALRRLVSAPSFRLKGSGWYETDFKQDRRRNVAESGDSSGNGAAQDGKSDAKGEGAGKAKVGHNLDGPRPKQESGGHDHKHGHGHDHAHGHKHGHKHGHDHKH